MNALWRDLSLRGMANQEKGVLDPETLSAFVSARHDVDGPVSFDVRALRGGLESRCTSRVRARFTDRRGGARTVSFVVKHLDGPSCREAHVYEDVVAKVARGMAPQVLGIDWMDEDACLLYLEAVNPAQRWPWQDTEAMGEVLARLAALHEDARLLTAPPWEYEADLRRCGAYLVDRLGRIDARGELGRVRAARPAALRLVEALPKVRRELMDASPLGTTIIHGDAHPGNVLVRRRRGSLEPLLLDWGRAREGSAFEDVSSWLHTLAFWERAAMQRHDTLLARYLVARGESGRLDRSVRDAMWLASACTVLGGAALHHVEVAERATGRERAIAVRAAEHAARILRRADACWN